MPSIDKSKSSTSSSPKKQRLGRGLGSLLSTNAADFEESSQKQAAPQSAPKNPTQKERKANASVPVRQEAKQIKPLRDDQRIWSLAIEKIKPNQTQPRKDFDKEPLQELAQSIKEQGIIQPITVRKTGETYEIIAGERRWRASQLAGLGEIPAILKNVDDQKSMELALIENLQREDLNPVEEAMGYQLLIDDYDLSQQDLAKKVGKSRSSVTNALRVLSLPRDVRQMLRQGLLSMGHAKVIMGVEDPKKQVKLARKAINKKWSVRLLEKQIKNLNSPNTSSVNSLDVSEGLAKGLATELQSVLGTKVNINYKGGKGRIEIAFYSDEELSSFVETVKNKWKS